PCVIRQVQTEFVYDVRVGQDPLAVATGPEGLAPDAPADERPRLDAAIAQVPVDLQTVSHDCPLREARQRLGVARLAPEIAAERSAVQLEVALAFLDDLPGLPHLGKAEKRLKIRRPEVEAWVIERVQTAHLIDPELALPRLLVGGLQIASPAMGPQGQERVVQ